jgi:hypothetical protein
MYVMTEICADRRSMILLPRPHSRSLSFYAVRSAGDHPEVPNLPHVGNLKPVPPPADVRAADPAPAPTMSSAVAEMVERLMPRCARLLTCKSDSADPGLHPLARFQYLPNLPSGFKRNR